MSQVSSRIGGALLLAALVASTLIVAPTATAAVGDLSEPATVVLNDTNTYRTGEGIPALVNDPALNVVAQAWAEQMADDQVLVHNGNLANEVPDNWTALAENIAWNSGRIDPAEHLVVQWIGSSGHRVNMLNVAYSHVGIGYFEDEGGRSWGVQVFAQFDGEYAPFELVLGTSTSYIAGASALLELEVDYPYTGEANLWYRTNGGSWARSGTGIAINDGVGSRVLNPSGVRQYFVELYGSTSNVVTYTQVIPDIIQSENASYVPGATAVISFTVDPASSGSATLQYRTDGGAWMTASSGVTLVEGVGSRTVRPSGVREYRIVFAGVTSDPVTLTPVLPEIAPSANASYVPGATAVISFAVDPASSGTAALQYRTDGGSWRTASSGVTIVDGVGSRTVRPSGVREYRIVFGGATSDAVTLTPILPEIFAEGSASYVPGATAVISFTVDPASSGTAALQYRTDGGSWRTSSSGVTIVDGVGSRTVRPSGVRDYRIVFAGVTSDAVTLTPILPTITPSGDAFYVPGATATISFAVEPASSGTATLQYRTDGGSWRTASSGVKILGGEGSRTVRPSGVREYRIVFGGATSDAVTLTPVVPTITPSEDAFYVPGESATISFTVDPASSGTATLQYRTDGGSWATSRTGVTIVSGEGSRTVNPSGVREYRIVFAGVTSDAITFTPAEL